MNLKIATEEGGTILEMLDALIRWQPVRAMIDPIVAGVEQKLAHGVIFWESSG